MELVNLQRRTLLQAGLGWGTVGVAGCGEQDALAHIEGEWSGSSPQRGHLLRKSGSLPQPTVTRRVNVVVAGAGIAGLSAARALRLRGVDDFCVLDLEDGAGGNSRGTALGGISCPLGAHYLPLPSDAAHDVQNFLEEQGLRQRVSGRWQYDERHLCHSPQERLYFQGEWQEGLLPLLGVGDQTRRHYQRFSELIALAQKTGHYQIPSSGASLSGVQREQDSLTFEQWLGQNSLTDAHLLWYLDYCCRDDYGAGISTVSAWAGIHYFASRHGFHVPENGTGPAGGQAESVLTWPQGNAWLAQRLSDPLGDRLHPGRVVTRIANQRHGVEVDVFDATKQITERWQAQHCIVALPVFVAARVVENPPQHLTQAAQRIRYAAWVVANIQISSPLHDRPGASPSWDNALYGAPGLGYVDAMHQSLNPVRGPTVLTYYRALGIDLAQRQALLNAPWMAWRDLVLAELAVPHPDLQAKARQIQFTRYGHAMAVPVPGFKTWLTTQVAPQVTPKGTRLSFAHADWAGYSVFEEAFTVGHRAGSQVT